MEINKIINYVTCPYCVESSLTISGAKLLCDRCKYSYDVVEGVPVLLKNDKLCLQELHQRVWFDKHYSAFPKEEYLLERWRLSILNRIFDTEFKSNVKNYLDIGCGATGYTVIEAAKKNDWVSFGVDLSLEAMIRAKNHSRQQGVEDKTGFIVCSAERLPFKQASFDYVSAVSLLEHLENDDKVIESFYSILKEQGYLFICVPNTYKRMWPFLWPIYFYLDRKIGHKRHYSIESLNERLNKKTTFEPVTIFYNGHLIKLLQILLEKIGLINDDIWWKMEKADINKVFTGVQLNAIHRKK